MSAALVLLLGAGVGALWLRTAVAGGPRSRVAVSVPTGSSIEHIAALLDRQGVVANAEVFRLYVRARGAGPFRAGRYTLRRGEPFDDLVDTLEKGPEATFDRLTVPEGLTLQQVAERVGRLPGRSAARFLQVASSNVVRSRYEPPGTTSLEGLLFPDTYHFDPKDDERVAVERMVATFDRVAAEAGLDKVTEGGLVTPYQALVVASLVEREARVPEDRGMVARVVYNRLRRGMPLQIDATVIYAQGRTGEKDLRLLDKDLAVDSPYNTYKVAGLPPTPIAAPGRAALDAAIDPTEGPWLYYVVVEPNGRHAFATTLAEHNRNIGLAQARGLR